MISKTDAQRAAETLISMCTDFLMGGLSQDVFASNLTLFAQRLDPKAAHAINQHEKLVAGIKEAADAMHKPAVRGEGDWQRGMFCGLEDRGIADRYDACVYGYDKALERVQEWVIAGLEALLKEEKP